MGRAPLYLLDTDLPVNSQVGRWITSRLYERNRSIRLAQYAVLGVFELQAQAQAPAASVEDTWQRVREQVVFTTHTPVPAGNETYQRAEVLTTLALRAMWQPLFPGRLVAEVPITHITNGVHVPTWLHGPMRPVWPGGRRFWRTTIFRWRAIWWRVVMCGSTCHARPTRPVAPAA